MNIIELTEYKSQLISRDQISPQLKQEIKQKYSSQLKITLQDTASGDRWCLTAQGWVGYIPISPELAIKLNPKVQIENIFGMLGYAYNLKSFRFLDGLTNCTNLNEFCDRLATRLGQLIRDRARKGLYYTYISKTDQLISIKGKIDLKTSLKQPWNPKLTCNYQEHTGDITDNQILLWTLRCISKCAICSPQVRPLIRQAYHALQGTVSLKPFTAQDCLRRKYNRLNQDYQTLHGLCRFFLEYSTPSHQTGDYTTLPFLVDMAQLYERFVAQWLKAHLPAKFRLKIQEQVKVSHNLKFRIDLIIYETATNKPLFVLDTKYKMDIQDLDYYQIVTYATQKQCQQAILIYPQASSKPINITIGNINVRSLTFALDNNLETSGQAFLDDLLSIVHSN